MDPRLRLLIESGDEGDEVAVLIRMGSPPSPLPTGARLVTVFGDVATIRAPRGLLADIRAADSVASVKAGTPVLAEPVTTWVAEPSDGTLRQERQARGLDNLPCTGSGVTLGLVDFGLDLTHPAFRKADGSTRLLALWDQQPGPQPDAPNRYGYGRIHDRASIDAALLTDDPGEVLGYRPEMSDPGTGTHGTATAAIAAGSGWPGGVPGLARNAGLVFVHLSTWGPEGPRRLGDSVALAEAFDFIRASAAGGPFVISCSLGGCCGPHDGSTLLERAMDNLVDEGQGLIAQSGGNYLLAGKHSARQLSTGQSARLTVDVPMVSLAVREIELWYAGSDRFDVHVTGPGIPRVSAPPGSAVTLWLGQVQVGRLVHRLDDPNDRRNQILLRLEGGAPAGRWDIDVCALSVQDGHFDVWIERDPAGRAAQARFPPELSVTSTTTGTVCNGRRTVVVGAYDPHSAGAPLAPFSSRGPTVDGRPKPDCCAPGVRTLVARSRPAGAGPADQVPLATIMSGTSMAAPHVAGLLACLLQVPGLQPSEARAAAMRTCRPYTGPDADRAGAGYVDPAAALADVLARYPFPARSGPPNGVTATLHQEMIMDDSSPRPGPDAATLGPSTPRAPSDVLAELGATAKDLVRAFVLDVAADREQLGARATLLGRAGELVDPELRGGDLLVRGAVGEGAALASTLVDGRLLGRDRATRMGWQLEGNLAGRYALVVEDGRRPHAAEDRFARRIADEFDLIPAGQALVRLVGDARTVVERADDEPVLSSALLRGDDQLAAVAAGRIRLARAGIAPYPAPVQSSGDGVRKVQEALVQLGYPVGSGGADGRFGGDTGRAVARYKADHHISPDDPVVGPTTIRRLDADLLSREAPSPVVPNPPVPPVSRTEQWITPFGSRLRAGNTVTGLIDGRETFAAYLAAIRTATGPGHFVYLLGWWLDLDVPLNPATQPAYCAGVPLAARSASTLRTLLRTADQAGVQVRVMLWDQTGSSQNTAEVHDVNRLRHGAAMLDNNQLASWSGSQHQKVLLVNGTEGLVAFCGGIDINPDRVCPTFPANAAPLLPGMPTPSSGGSGQTAGESASVPQLATGVLPESSGSSGGGGDPLHDVHVRITGPAADDLLEVFVHRWYANPDHMSLDRSKGALQGLCRPPSPVTGQALVRIDETFSATYAPPRRPVHDCTTPPPLAPVIRVRERGVQDAYLTAINRARRFIYWEDQYMVNMCAAEHLRRALARVDFIILLMADSTISDLPHRWAWRKRFVEHIRRDANGAKMRIFTLRDPVTGSTAVHTYVHAKTMMVDDELAIVGSANCNLRGWESDTEVTASVVGDLDQAGRPFAARLRQRLWAEHLGVPEAMVADPLVAAPLWWLPNTGPGRSVTLPGGRVVALPDRRVLPYDVNAGSDSLRDRAIPDDIADPPAALPGSACGGISPRITLAGAGGRELVAPGGVQSFRFAVG